MSVAHNTLQDLAGLFGVSVRALEEPWLPELHLYDTLTIAGKLATRSQVSSHFKPTTAIGKTAEKIALQASPRGITQSDSSGGCWEAEPRLLRSLEYLAQKRTPRFEPARVYVTQDADIIGYEKHNGIPTVLITQPHPYFGNLPAGCIVDDGVPGRQTDETLLTSNPALEVEVVPDHCATPPLLVRPSVLVVSPEERQWWGYDVTKILQNDEYLHLVPAAKEVARMSLAQCIGRIYELAAPHLSS